VKADKKNSSTIFEGPLTILVMEVLSDRRQVEA